MNSKNFNMLEQHVEKLVLALAVAGAGWMIYLSLQPEMIVDGGKPLEVADVERQVEASVNKLEVAKKATADRGVLKVSIEDYEGEYGRKTKNPLGNELVSAAVPSFIPHQTPVVQMNLTPSKVGTGLVKTPTVPEPVDLAAVPWRGIVLKPGEMPPAPGAMLPPAATPGRLPFPRCPRRIRT